jgi:hypothetical protein
MRSWLLAERRHFIDALGPARYLSDDERQELGDLTDILLARLDQIVDVQPPACDHAARASPSVPAVAAVRMPWRAQSSLR